jgi:hypothetical protein
MASGHVRFTPASNEKEFLESNLITADHVKKISSVVLEYIILQLIHLVAFLDSERREY